jgi:hypothetical protein
MQACHSDIGPISISCGAYSERWDGDRLSFGFAAMGQTVAGVVNVLDAAVTIEIELPGVLGIIASRLKDRMRKAGQLLLTKKWRRFVRVPRRLRTRRDRNAASRPVASMRADHHRRRQLQPRPPVFHARRV